MLNGAHVSSRWMRARNRRASGWQQFIGKLFHVRKARDLDAPDDGVFLLGERQRAVRCNTSVGRPGQQHDELGCRRELPADFEGRCGQGAEILHADPLNRVFLGGEPLDDRANAVPFGAQIAVGRAHEDAIHAITRKVRARTGSYQPLLSEAGAWPSRSTSALPDWNVEVEHILACAQRLVKPDCRIVAVIGRRHCR